MADLTACLLYAKIHKNKGKNLLHLMLYFSFPKAGRFSALQAAQNMVQ